MGDADIDKRRRDSADTCAAPYGNNPIVKLCSVKLTFAVDSIAEIVSLL